MLGTLESRISHLDTRKCIVDIDLPSPDFVLLTAPIATSFAFPDDELPLTSVLHRAVGGRADQLYHVLGESGI
jgi:hypothetical protein